MEDWISDLYIKEKLSLKVFTKVGCPPCVQLKPVMEQFENVEFLDAIENLKEYNLRQAPTVVIEEGGKEVGRFTGFKTKEEVIEILNNYKND